MLKLNTQLVSFDWQDGLTYANGKVSLAQELTRLFATELVEFSKLINEAVAKRDNQQLQTHLHKLLGGCNYCGVPRMRDYVREFEKLVRQNPTSNFQDESSTLLAEIALVLEAIKTEPALAA